MNAKVAIIERKKKAQSEFEMIDRAKFNAPSISEQKRLIMELEKIQTKIQTYDEVLQIM